MADDSRSIVASRAESRCEYCRMHQSLQGATFHIEHVIPRIRGGTSELDNLALACPSCNLHKADRVSSSPDHASGTIALFHPRKDVWNDHFEWADYQIVGKSDVGCMTIQLLDLNHERRIKIRQAEQLFGLFPPQPPSD
nr:HNH endonuclease signature motif containing protein [Rosistilla oblonga]